MRWLKVKQAKKEWFDDLLGEKTIYAAIRSGKLKAARYGSGRNVLLCEAWCDEWLTASAKAPVQGEPRIEGAARPVILQRRAVR